MEQELILEHPTIEIEETEEIKTKSSSRKKMKEEIEEIKKEMTLSDLPGVGAATIEKLQSAGYLDVISIAVASPGELVEAGGLTEATARKVIKAARDTMNMGFESGDELLEKRKNLFSKSF